MSFLITFGTVLLNSFEFTKPNGVRAGSVNSRWDIDVWQPLVSDWNVDVMLATTKSRRIRSHWTWCSTAQQSKRRKNSGMKLEKIFNGQQFNGSDIRFSSKLWWCRSDNAQTLSIMLLLELWPSVKWGKGKSLGENEPCCIFTIITNTEKGDATHVPHGLLQYWNKCTHTNTQIPLLSDHSCQESSDKKCSSAFPIEKSPIMTNADCLTVLPPQGRPLHRYKLYCSRSHPLYPPPVCPLRIQIPPNTCPPPPSLPNTQNTSVLFHLEGPIYSRFPV